MIGMVLYANVMIVLISFYSRENNCKFFAKAGPRTDIDDTPLGKRRRVDHKDVLEGVFSSLCSLKNLSTFTH